MNGKVIGLVLEAFLIMAIAPVPRLEAQFMYVAHRDSDNISAYRIDSNGSLILVSGSPFATGHTP
jgi:hypothetical protein